MIPLPKLFVNTIWIIYIFLTVNPLYCVELTTVRETKEKISQLTIKNVDWALRHCLI